jgi:hypothetical protein
MAVNHMKMMLAFILLTYDVKTKDGKRPPNQKYQTLTAPNMTAEILFRKRQVGNRAR